MISRPEDGSSASSTTMTDVAVRTATPDDVARFGLGEPRDPVHAPPDDWSGFLASLEVHRLTGLAVAAEEAGALRLTAEQAEDLTGRHREAMTTALTIERELLQVEALLRAAGVGVVVLKGPAVAHSAYPDPSWRPFGDLDLLVRTADWRGACEVLERSGRRRRLPEPRPGFDERFGKAAVHRGGSGIQVDLHRTLVVGPFGLWIRPEEVFERTVPLRLGGRAFERLDDTSLLLHACVHAALGWRAPFLWTVRDVAQIAPMSGVDWEALAALAERWRLQVVVQHALRMATEVLGVPIPPEAGRVMALPAGRSERRALDAYVTTQRTRGGTAVSTLRAIPGVVPKAAYVRALLFPRRDFLRERDDTRKPSYVRRWMTGVRRMAPRREP
jgi:Uncharacterised nucleotidyltransferase